MLTTSALTEESVEFTETDRRMMARAIELAANGVGRVSPGPLVGCVIVDSSGEIAGEGFYVYEDVKHAETRMFLWSHMLITVGLLPVRVRSSRRALSGS